MPTCLSLPAVLSFVLLTTVSSALGQAIDNYSSVRIVDAERYVRLHYENDFFTKHDLYYTQGINFEIVNPAYKKLFIMKLLVTPAGSVGNYGIALEHNAYTPSSITHSEILQGDRPFTANLFLKFFSFSHDPVRRLRITSSLSAGVIGSVASGYWIQKTIHGWLNTTKPQGWDNQIANDIVLNYEAGAEENLFAAGNSMVFNARANARIGTLSDKLTAGFVLMAGKLNPAITSVFSGTKNACQQKFNFHFYAEPLVNLIGYDATLQGGLFNRSSPYTLSAKEIKRTTYQINYGLVIQYRALSVEYFKSAITEEFKGGMKHRWGGLRIAWVL